MMNQYCPNCKELCEEIIPTYNCKYQMETTKRELLVEFLNEFKSVHATMYHNIDNIIEELQKIPVTQPVVIQPREINYGTVVEDFNRLSFTDQRTVFIKLFGLGNMGETIDNKLILLSLIVSFYLKAKEKSPEMTMLDAVNRLVENESIVGDPSFSENYKEKLAILAEEFSFNVKTGNTFGIKNAVDLKAKVNDIIKSQLPF